MSTKKKYVVTSEYKNFDDEKHRMKVIVKSNTEQFNYNVRFTAKTLNNDEGYLPHARNQKVLTVIDDGNGLLIPDSEGDKIYLDYSEVLALKMIFAVDDYMENIEHSVKMKSIKPEGTTVAYQDDPNDSKLDSSVEDAPCDNCEHYPWCDGCEFNDE